MEADLILRAVREGLLLVLLVSAPPLLASLLVGLVVSVLQAATQVQETTLGFVPKLVTVFVVLAATAPWIGAQLVRFTRAVLAALPAIGS